MTDGEKMYFGASAFMIGMREGVSHEVRALWNLRGCLSCYGIGGEGKSAERFVSDVAAAIKGGVEPCSNFEAFAFAEYVFLKHGMMLPLVSTLKEWRAAGSPKRSAGESDSDFAARISDSVAAA